jgi:hypothetical protein
MFQGRVETRLIQKKQAIHTNHGRRPRQSRAALLTLALAAAETLGAPAARASPLDRVFSYYQNLKDFSATFRQTKTLAAEGLTLKSSGVLRVSLGRALLWSVEEPAPLAVFLDAERLVLRSGAGNKATTTAYDLKTSSFSEKIAASMKELTALLAMDRVALTASYDVADREGGLVLTPRHPRQFKRVRMAVQPGAAPWINGLAIDELSGDRMDLSFAAPVKGDSRWMEAWTHPAHPGG